MARPDFTLKWAGSRVSIPPISAGNYAAGWDTYLGPLPPLGDDHDFVMNLQDSRAIWLGEQMLLAVGHEWQSDVTYDAYAITRSPVDGQLYRSLTSGNIGNEPSVSGAQWALGVADSADLLNAPIATVAAASTIDLTAGAPDTSQLAISGTGVSINGFTVASNRFFVVKMQGANTLVHSASLVTPDGENIATSANDSFLMRATAADTVEVVAYFRKDRRFIGSPVATTSGTAHDFTGIPAWANKITVMFSGVSVSGTSIPQIQLGDGAIDAAGYLGSTADGLPAGTTAALHNTGFLLGSLGNANYTRHGALTLTRFSGNTWAASGALGLSDTARAMIIGGTKTLSGALDRIRLTTVNGTDTFDAGSFNIEYEE